MNTSDYIFLAIAIVFIISAWAYIHFIYNKERNQFNKYGAKGLVYYYLSKKLHFCRKNDKEVDSYLIINKFLNETKPPDKKINLNEWQAAIEFWLNIFKIYPDELINKLENNINISDIEHLNKLIYSKNPNAYFKENISKKIKELGIRLKNDPRGLQQANRLGYFAIKGNIIIDARSKLSGNWLELWNEFLELKGDDRLKMPKLVINPLDVSSRRNIKTNKNNVQKLLEYFVEMKWETGVKLAKNILSEKSFTPLSK